MSIPDDIFFDKEISDIVRDIVLNSPCNPDEAIRLIGIPKDKTKGAVIIKELKNVGFGEKRINNILLKIEI